MPDLSLSLLHFRKVLAVKDSFERNISYLRLSVTSRCSLNCIYCTAGASDCCRCPDELSADEILEIARGAALAGFTKIRLTGGEPLIRGDITKICREIHKISQIKELCLTTNGIGLAPAAHDLRDSGVSRVNISIDSADPAVLRRITGRSCLNDVVAGIEAAVSAGFESVKLNAVLLKGVNDDVQSIRQLAGFVQKYPVDLRFIELMPVKKKGFSFSSYFSGSDAVLRALPDLEMISPQGFNEGVADMYRLPGACGRIGIISPVTACFCRSCCRMRVTSDGKLRPCLLRNEEFSIRGLNAGAVADEIRRAVFKKPSGHDLSPGTVCLRNASDHETADACGLEMQRIGG